MMVGRTEIAGVQTKTVEIMTPIILFAITARKLAILSGIVRSCKIGIKEYKLLILLLLLRIHHLRKLLLSQLMNMPSSLNINIH